MFDEEGEKIASQLAADRLGRGDESLYDVSIKATGGWVWRCVIPLGTALGWKRRSAVVVGRAAHEGLAGARPDLAKFISTSGQPGSRYDFIKVQLTEVLFCYF